LERAGFESGDIVISIDGSRVQSEADALEAISLIAKAEPTTVRVLRVDPSGARQEIVLEIGSLDPD
jgi:S1-C subfamily serine protease